MKALIATVMLVALAVTDDEIFAESEKRFFLKVVDAQITFDRRGRPGGLSDPAPGRANDRRHAGRMSTGSCE
jgi:hypothetical protein